MRRINELRKQQDKEVDEFAEAMYKPETDHEGMTKALGAAQETEWLIFVEEIRGGIE